MVTVMPKLTVDGLELEVPAGATVLQACELAEKEISYFCGLEGAADVNEMWEAAE